MFLIYGEMFFIYALGFLMHGALFLMYGPFTGRRKLIHILHVPCDSGERFCGAEARFVPNVRATGKQKSKWNMGLPAFAKKPPGKMLSAVH